MKKLLYFPMLIAAAIFACSDDLDDVTLEPTPSLSLSATSISFTKEGGHRTVVVAAGSQEWTIETTPSWIRTTRDDDSFTVHVEGASEERAVSSFVYINAGELRDSVYVMQSGLVAAEDLSAAGLANSYIAKPGNDYRINATVKGNGSFEDGNSNYIENYGIAIEGAAYADLLWETTPDGDRTRSREIIGYPVLRDGYIYFSTLKNPGNALVAVKNAAGEVLWSWHIWIIEDEIKTSVAEVGDYRSVWMDRNLGAMNNTPGDIGNRGLFYQGGRKDPFPASPIAATEAVADYQFNYTTGKGSGSWNYALEAPLTDTPPANIPLATQNPMSFIYPSLSTYIDWYIPYTGNANQQQSCLWGELDPLDIRKTIFDPCPAGYTVPPMQYYSGGGRTPLTSMWRYEADSDGWFDGWYWQDGTDDYFPFVGRLKYIGGGYIEETINASTYWARNAASAAATGNYGLMMWIYTVGQNTPVVGFTGNSRAYGFSVRCVEEP